MNEIEKKQAKREWRQRLMRTAQNAPDQGFNICVMVEPLLKTWARLQSGEDEVWERLAELNEGCTFKYLKAVVSNDPNRISQRLTSLRKAGFVIVEKQGKSRLYRTNMDACLQMIQFVDRLTKDTGMNVSGLIRMFSVLSLPINFLAWHRLMICNSTVTQLTEYMKAQQAEVSAALSALRAVEMVGFEREGNTNRYFAKIMPVFIKPARECLIETGLVELPEQELYSE